MRAFRNGPAAVLAAVAFGVGTIAIPALHLAFHALPHDHVGGAIHYHDDDDDDHDDAEHRRHHREPFDPHHGDGSAAHFALAVSDAAASAIVLVASPFTPCGAVAEPARRRAGVAHVSVHRVRGPPALS